MEFMEVIGIQLTRMGVTATPVPTSGLRLESYAISEACQDDAVRQERAVPG